MKKRLSFICIYICLLSLFCLGAAELLFADKEERLSQSENRMLQAFPTLNLTTLTSADFMNDFESWLSDAFFFRDEAAGFHDGLMGLIALPEKGPATGIVADEELWDQSAEQDADFQQLLQQEEQNNQQESSVEEPVQAEINTADVRDVSLWLERSDGKKEVLATYSAKDIAAFAEVLNKYSEKLPEDGKLYFFSPQVSDIANNMKKALYVDWGTDLVEVMQPLVNENVVIADNLEMLSPYLGVRNVYPVLDYHWHAIGASITVDSLMSAQGFAPADYDQYRYYLSNRHNGVAYSTEMLSNMRYGTDVIEIMSPISPGESYMLNHLDQREKAVFTMYEGGYMGFLGGHFGPWRLIEGGFHTGRNALIVGDCFNTPFIVYLTPYYDQIISTDVRDNFYSVERAGANISEYMDFYDVDDIYVIWSTNSRFYSAGIRNRMLTYLDMAYPD